MLALAAQHQDGRLLMDQPDLELVAVREGGISGARPRLQRPAAMTVEALDSPEVLVGRILNRLWVCSYGCIRETTELIALLCFAQRQAVESVVEG